MKTLLASKNKLHRELREEVGATPGLDMSRVDSKMAALNERFQNCASLAEQWERALQEAANRWENLYDAEKKALDWLAKADVHLADNRDPEASRVSSLPSKRSKHRVNQAQYSYATPRSHYSGP